MIDIEVEKVYRLDSITRYNTMPRIKNESVASHSFYVAYFCKKVCTMFDLSDTIRLYSIEAALMHDIPEIDTNDITHDVKHKVPGLSQLLKPYEEAIIKEESITAYKVLFETTTIEESVAKAVVDYADVLSVLQYCQNEVNMGNKAFYPLLENTVVRLQKANENLNIIVDAYNLQKAKGGK